MQYFKNSKGQRLAGILSAEEGWPVIITCHGFRSSKDRPTYLDLEKTLKPHKIGVFRFDFAGVRDSEGKFEEITISQSVDDLNCAYKFVKEKGFDTIGLFGSSFGGTVALIAAPKLDIKLLALASPVSDYVEVQNRKKDISEWKRQGYNTDSGKDGTSVRVNYSFYEDGLNNISYETSKDINVPTFIVHGKADQSVPIEQSIKTSKLIPNCELRILDDVDHYYVDSKGIKHHEEKIRLLAEFIVKNVFV